MLVLTLALKEQRRAVNCTRLLRVSLTGEVASALTLDATSTVRGAACLVSGPLLGLKFYGYRRDARGSRVCTMP